jgi:hypothetical protein
MSYKVGKKTKTRGTSTTPLHGLEQRKNIGIVEDMSCIEEIPVALFGTVIRNPTDEKNRCRNSMKIVQTNLIDYNVL